MKKLRKYFSITLLIAGLSFIYANECQPSLQDKNSLEEQETILLGELKLSDIEDFEWYKENFNSYKPDISIVESISKKAKNRDLKIEIYFGTWCPDSQREVPRLIKLLEISNFNMNNVKLIGLDRDKIVPNLTEKKAKELDIQMVPTFVFYEDNTYLNRFVEFAVKTLEDDVLSILSDEDYQHSYKF